jgi:hypothetical protein
MAPFFMGVHCFIHQTNFAYVGFIKIQFGGPSWKAYFKLCMSFCFIHLRITLIFNNYGTRS